MIDFQIIYAMSTKWPFHRERFKGIILLPFFWRCEMSINIWIKNNENWKKRQQLRNFVDLSYGVLRWDAGAQQGHIRTNCVNSSTKIILNLLNMLKYKNHLRNYTFCCTKINTFWSLIIKTNFLELNSNRECMFFVLHIVYEISCPLIKWMGI